MKKLSIVIVVVVIVGGLGLPPLLGSMTENAVRTHIDAWNENPMFALRVESYDRNWFTSQARIAVGIDPEYARMVMPTDDPGANLAAAMIADMSLPFTLDVQHGPIVLSDGLFVGLSKVVARISDDSQIVGEVQRQLAMPYLVQMSGRVSLTGTFTFDGDVPPVDYADESSEIRFSGATFGGRYKDRHLESHGGIDEFSFNTGTGAAVVAGIRLTGDTEFVSSMIGIGTMQAAVERIIVNDALSGPEPTVVVDRLGFSTNASLDDSGTLLNGSVTYSADSVVVPASEFDLRNAQATIALTNLSAEAIQEYYEMIMAADPQDPGAAMQYGATLLGRLLENKPTLSVAPLRFEYGGEPFTADLEVRTVGDASQLGSFDQMNPIALATMFEVTLNANASKTLVANLATRALAAQISASMPPEALPPGQDATALAGAQVQLMLAQSLGMGYIVDDGEAYRTTLTYANGEVRVNGSALPLDALL